jgi:hypothetical protein
MFLEPAAALAARGEILEKGDSGSEVGGGVDEAVGNEFIHSFAMDLPALHTLLVRKERSLT